MRFLFLICFLFVGLFAKAQFPITQNQGSPTTLIKSRGGQQIDSGLVIGVFADTTAANGGFIDAIPGIMIRTISPLNTFYFRNSTATQWLPIASSSVLDSLITNGIIEIDFPENQLLRYGGDNWRNTYRTDSSLLPKAVTDSLYLTNIYYVVGSGVDTLKQEKDGVLTVVGLLSQNNQGGNSGTYIVSGCAVVWTGTGLTFYITDCACYINGTLYTAPDTTVTLDAADATYNRIDAFVMDTSNASYNVTGTAEENPITPQADPTYQILLTSVLVNANDTAFAAPREVIYNNNSGGEWTNSSPIAYPIDFFSTAETFIPPYAADWLSGGPQRLAYFTLGADSINVSGYQSISAFVKLKAQLASANSSVAVQFYNNGQAVSTVTRFPLVRTNTDWQAIQLPLSSFAYLTPNRWVDSLVVSYRNFNGAAAITGMYFDYFSFNSGINPPNPNGNNVDSFYYSSEVLNDSMFVMKRSDGRRDTLTINGRGTYTAGNGIKVSDLDLGIIRWADTLTEDYTTVYVPYGLNYVTEGGGGSIGIEKQVCNKYQTDGFGITWLGSEGDWHRWYIFYAADDSVLLAETQVIGGDTYNTVAQRLVDSLNANTDEGFFAPNPSLGFVDYIESPCNLDPDENTFIRLRSPIFGCVSDCYIDKPFDLTPSSTTNSEYVIANGDSVYLLSEGNQGYTPTTSSTAKYKAVLMDSTTGALVTTSPSNIGGGNYVDSVYRVAGVDSINIRNSAGYTYKVKDSTGIGGTLNDSRLVFSANGQVKDTSILSYDRANVRVGIGTAAPTHSLTFPSTSTGIALYNTADQTTNYERILARWASNEYRISFDRGGTGSVRPIFIGNPGGDEGFRVTPGNAITGRLNVQYFNVGIGSLFGANGTMTASGAVTTNGIALIHTVNQSSTSGYRGLWISPYLQALGSGTNRLVDVGTNTATSGAGTHTSLFNISNTGQAYFANTVGIGTTSPNASALLDITSTTKGFLTPRLTGTQQNAVSSPATGLLVYNTDSVAHTYYDGSAWRKYAVAGSYVDSVYRVAGVDSIYIRNKLGYTYALKDSAGGGSGITELTGDVTAGPGSGSQAATLATVNANVGSFTNANITVNAKGLITAASTGAGGSGTVTSVGLTMPSAFSVAGSPVTTSGTLAVTGAGTTAQYIRGDGSLANFSPNDSIAIRRSGSNLQHLTSFNANSATGGGTAGAVDADSANVFVGLNSGAAVTTGYRNFGFGPRSFLNLTTGHSNTAIGYNSGSGITTGSQNIGVGISSFSSSAVTGDQNISIGGSLNSLTSGTRNIAIGGLLSAVTTGGNNVAIGYQSGNGVSGSFNVFAGVVSGAIGSGSYNAAFGHNSLSLSGNKTGNTAIGPANMTAVSTGGYNTSLGYVAGYNISSGSYNLAIGSTNTAVGTGVPSATGSYQVNVANWLYRNSSGFAALNGVATTTNPPTITTSVVFDIVSTIGGFRSPLMTRAQKVAISTPAQGLQVTDTDNRAVWLNLNGSTTTWGAIYAAQDTVATNADFTMPVYSSFVILPTITANRTITLPVAASYENKTIILKVANSDGTYAWSVAVAIKDKTDADVTALTNDTVYTLYSDGTNWHITSLY